MWRRKSNDVARVAKPLVAVAIFGSVAFGCREDRAPTSFTSPAAAAAVDAKAAPAVAAVAMPVGWRNLRFGLSEADAKKVILEYRRDPKMAWTQAATTNLATVRLDLQKIDSVSVDRKRFHEWSIPSLDDGAKLVRAWFDDGKLVAIQVEGTSTPETFLRKAAEAYGPAPKSAPFTFFDPRTGSGQIRNVTYWQGDTTTAFVWVSASIPSLLLWSNAAMGDLATQYQTTVDAPALAATKEEQVRENGTKF